MRHNVCRTLAAVTAGAFLIALAAPAQAGITLISEPTLVPQPPLVNEQLVTAQLDPSGLPSNAEIVNRIVANNLPKENINAETSTVDLRYLDRSGAPEVVGNEVVYPVGGPGETSVSTQAQFNSPLPVALHAEYATPGEGAKGIDPDSVAGKSGDMSITYTVTNTSISREKISYADAAGNVTTKVEPVFAPFVGALIAKLPPGVALQNAGTAVVNTTKDGNTSLQWNLLLYPPLGNYQQDLTFKVTGADLAVPEVLMEVIPVTNAQDPAIGFSSELLTKSLEGNTKLASGLTTLDESASKLAVGAQELAVAQSEAAKGTAAAADGSAGITVGAAALTTGLVGLSAALDEFAGPRGLPKAAKSTGEIADAVDQLVDAIGKASDPPIPPTPPFPTNLTLVQAARVAESATTALRNLSLSAAANEAGAIADLFQAQADLCGLAGADCTNLNAGLLKVQQAAVKNAAVAAGLQLLNTQVLAKITAGIISVSNALKSGTTQSVYGALKELQASLAAASVAMSSLAKGSEAAEEGAGELTGFSDELTKGLNTLTAGSNQLATGGDSLATGADQLQEDGTSKVLNDVIASSSDPSFANAYLNAASKRAGDAAPYPAPKGAVARVGYVYVLPTPPTQPGMNPALIGIGLVVLATLALVVVRRLRRPVEPT